MDTRPQELDAPLPRNAASGWRQSWQGLRNRLLSLLGQDSDLDVQYLGMLPRDVQQLERLLVAVSAQLGIIIRVQPKPGDVLVIEQGFAMKMAPAALNALCEKHPVVLVALDVPALVSRQGAERLFDSRRRELLRQLSSLSVVRRRQRRRR